MPGSTSYASPRSESRKPGSASAPPGHITRRRFLQAAGVSAAGLAVYSAEFARHDLQFTQRTIAIRNLPPAFHNFRITQISDIHFDDYTEPIYLRHTIERVNTLTSDLVLITGDFITHGPPRTRTESAIYTCAQILSTIACPLRFSCLGNHDTAAGPDFIAGVVREHGIPVLINQYQPVEKDGQRLWIGGVEDPSTRYPLLDSAVPERPDGPVILMAHAPDYYDFVRSTSRGQLVDLMLSGHSHGGQVRFPIVGPLMLPPGGRKYVRGHFELGKTQLYVNRGLGAVGLPFRLNCPPEITTFTLVPA